MALTVIVSLATSTSGRLPVAWTGLPITICSPAITHSCGPRAG
jgi:hypothetical protein